MDHSRERTVTQVAASARTDRSPDLHSELVRRRQSIVAGEQTVHVLLVEDNRDDAELFRRMLADRALGVFNVMTVGLLSDAITYLGAHHVDIVLLDLGLPDATGLGALHQIHAASPEMPLIVLTGSIDQRTSMQALQEGAQDVLIKGVVADHPLQRALHHAIERQRSVADAERVQQQQLDFKDQQQAHQLRVRDEFLSHVSHELRTPLAAIHWFTTNLMEGLLGVVNADQREHLETTLKNANQLKRMLDDLLDAARANAGKLSATPREQFLDGVIADAVATCRARMVVPGVVCRVVDPGGLPPAWADPDRTSQVMVNLIDNAIRFTPQNGTISVAVRVDDDPAFLRVSVSDSGCGVAPENRRRIFERLFQASSGAEESRMGLGLGLFISAELISLQGGRIWVEGEVGLGATFSFTLPIFSLRTICAPILTPRHLERGVLTLMTIVASCDDLTSEARAARFHETGRALERCIVSGQDLVLPRMFGPKSLEPFYILAGTDEAGADVIARRICEELTQAMPQLYANNTPTITFTPITWPQRVDQDVEGAVVHIVARLHELVNASVPGRR